MGKRWVGILILFILIVAAAGWYATQTERAIAALDANSGRLVWQRTEPRPLGDFAFDDKRMVAWTAEPDLTRRLGAWDSATGAPLWTYDPATLLAPYGDAASTQLARLPVLSDNHVYFVITVDEDPEDLELVVALDAARGEFLWMKELNVFMGSHTQRIPLVASNDRVFLFTEGDNAELNLMALHGFDGEPAWLNPATASTRDGNPARIFGGQTLPLATAPNSDLLFVTTLGSVTAFDLRNGELQWETALATPARTHYEVADATLYLEDDTTLSAIAMYSGEERWHVPLSGIASENELAPRGDGVALLERGQLMEPTSTLVWINNEAGEERWRTTYQDSVVEGLGNQVAATPATVLLYDTTLSAFVGYSTEDGTVRWQHSASTAPYVLADYGDHFYVNAELPRWQWWMMRM